MGRIGRYIRCKNYSTRVGVGAPVFVAAVMEYLCAEVLDVAGEICKEAGYKRITPRYIELAVRKDIDLARLFQNKSISEGGTAPINNQSLSKSKILLGLELENE